MHSPRTFFTVAVLVCGGAARATADDRTRGDLDLDDEPSTSVLPYLEGGIALTGAAGATIFFLDAKRARRDADAHYRTDPVFADDRSRFVVERAAGFAFAGLGALGVGLIVYHWLRPAPTKRSQLGLGVTPEGALVTFGGSL